MHFYPEPGTETDSVVVTYHEQRLIRYTGVQQRCVDYGNLWHVYNSVSRQNGGRRIATKTYFIVLL